MVMNMKTGNQIFKYYTYSIIWANKIIAGVKGYSIDKAYQIEAVFGSMVERQLDDYQKQLDRLRYTASVFGVFDECKSMFDDFYETNKKDINYLLKNDKDMETEVYIQEYWDGHSPLTKEMRQAIAFNAMWDKKMAYVMEQIGNISLEKTKWLPAQYANIFKEQHKIVSDLVENIGVYNKLRYDYECEAFETDITSRDVANEYGEIEADYFYQSSMTQLNEWVNKEIDKYLETQRENITAYHNNMQLLNKIREDLLND